MLPSPCPSPSATPALSSISTKVKYLGIVFTVCHLAQNRSFYSKPLTTIFFSLLSNKGNVRRLSTTKKLQCPLSRHWGAASPQRMRGRVTAGSKSFISWWGTDVFLSLPSPSFEPPQVRIRSTSRCAIRWQKTADRDNWMDRERKLLLVKDVIFLAFLQCLYLDDAFEE